MARPLFFFCVWVRVARPLFFSFVFGYPNTKEKKRSVPKHKRKKAVWPRGTKFSLPFILGIHPIIIQLYNCYIAVLVYTAYHHHMNIQNKDEVGGLDIFAPFLAERRYP